MENNEELTEQEMMEKYITGKKFEPSDVVEVSVYGDGVIMFPLKDTCSDCLKITKSEAKYQRHYWNLGATILDKKEDYEWRYQANGKWYDKKYERLCEELAKLDPRDQCFISFVTDVETYTVKVSLKDGAEVAYPFWHVAEHLRGVFSALLKFVPQGAHCMHAINYMYENVAEKMTAEDAKDLTFEDIVAVTYENGRPSIIDRYRKLYGPYVKEYLAHCAYDYDAYFREICKYTAANNIAISEYKWSEHSYTYIRLGAKKHLLMRTDVYNAIGHIFMDPDESVRNALWTNFLADFDLEECGHEITEHTEPMPNIRMED